MADSLDDARVRAAAFGWLSEQVERQGDVLPRTLLAKGFLLDGVRVPLVGPQGIFKPQALRGAPLSITTRFPPAPTTTPSALTGFCDTAIGARIRTILTTAVSAGPWNVVCL